jgi:hypothetical protein
MDTNIKTCPDCDVALQLRFAPHSDTHCSEVSCCVRCKYQEQGDLCAGEVQAEPEFTLTIAWKPNELSLETIKTLRNIDPKLTHLPMTEVFHRLRAQQQWDISELSHNEMRKIELICKKLNIIYKIS